MLKRGQRPVHVGQSGGGRSGRSETLIVMIIIERSKGVAAVDYTVQKVQAAMQKMQLIQRI
tara:strand:+ start:421 stop:603 length:183 start_codon:yes stop_codon:yes gene_type:complete